ncbi:uncharacterized protein LOC122616775 isoform X2 [Drosophila teissieri]|uniref:uncharacterized protein LOC122616775 isoform X2 n=1 Tax=Drosophila teissieri TaxID=7243 RepID=UPI001CBA3422|nr:uncharacterized protein LOC122616775 isoform X2 [Drosophila teissieri]
MKCTSAEKKTFWDIFFTLIEENTTVTSCILHYMPYDMYCPDHIEIFEKTMKIFSEKKSLNYSPEHLEQFHNLKSLSLFVPMRANELIECVKSNPKLTNLEFTSPHIYGRLADIAPYCGNLESLTIHMKPETDASEYSPLAKLPKLKIFDIFGYPREGSLNALFGSMALNDTVLQYISIRQAKLGTAEVEELSKVHVNRLNCELMPSRLRNTPALLQLPNISALDLGMEPLKHNNLYYNSIHIMSNMGHIALSIHKKSDQDVLLRLHDWHNMLQGGTNPLWFEKQNLLQQIQMRNNSECGKKVAYLLLLEALQSQLPTITQNIHRLTEIGGLKELEVKIKLNIEEELRKFVDSSDFVSFEDLEGDIAIDADVQNIIILVQLTYLKDILKISKYTNIKNSLAIQNYSALAIPQLFPRETYQKLINTC